MLNPVLVALFVFAVIVGYKIVYPMLENTADVAATLTACKWSFCWGIILSVIAAGGMLVSDIAETPLFGELFWGYAFLISLILTVGSLVGTLYLEIKQRKNKPPTF